MEESQKECVSGSDQERRGEKDDGETVGWRWRITEKEKYQDVQRNSGGEVCLPFPPTLSFTFIYIYIYAFSRRFYPKRLTLHSSYSFYI